MDRNAFEIHLRFFETFNPTENNLDEKIDNLHPTDEREPSEEPHGAADHRENIDWLVCPVFSDAIKCGSIKIYPHISQL